MVETDESETPAPRDFRVVKGMDPNANWLLGFGVKDYLRDPKTTRIPLLFEPLNKEAASAFNNLKDREGVTVLGFGLKNDLVEEGELVPLLVSRDWLESLFDGSPKSNAFLDANKRVVLSVPVDPPEETEYRESPPMQPQSVYSADVDDDAGGGILVAAVDDGFAFAHERFQDKNGKTRIVAFWDMTQGYPLPMPPQGVLTKQQIDKAVAAETTVDGITDEEAVYQRTGLLNYASGRHKPLAWRVSHGTHVLDLAAGSDPGEGGPPIVAVQLPSPVVARTIGDLLDIYVWIGVNFILEQAKPKRPLLINISFGYDAGPHDGKGLLEKHLSKLVNKREHTAVVLPAGNAQLSRCHATIDLQANAQVKLDWIVQPEDRTYSVIEVWLPEDTKDGGRMRLTIVLPDGTTKVEISEPAFPAPAGPLASEPLMYAGRQMGLVALWERHDDRRMFHIAIAPTARAQPHDGPLAPAGRWTLIFDATDEKLLEPAHAWVQRDDSLYGYPQRGRQSYFDHKDYVRFDDQGYEMDEDPPGTACPVTRTSLLNAIATSRHVVVAGGYRSRDCRIARYSSGGPDTPPETWAANLRKPDVLLPCDGSPAHPGVLAAGARSGARVAMDGTSVSAPQLARYIAGWLATEVNPGRPAVLKAIQTLPVPCVPAPLPIPTSPDRDGHGRLARLDQVHPPPFARFEPGD